MWIALSAIFGAGWPRWIPDAARACAARVDRRSMPGDWRTGASPRQTMAGGDVGGRVTDGVDSPVAVGGRIAQGQWLFNRGRAGFACVNKPGWLWPLRMAKRVSERATRGGEHGGIGTPHARGASGEILGVGSEEASSISFYLRARWLVSSLTRRRGGPPALRPSGRGPGYGGASEREIGPPNPVGGGFVSGI